MAWEEIMYGFAAYDIAKARGASASARARTVAPHLDAAAARRGGSSLWARLTHLVAPASGARPVCCAA